MGQLLIRDLDESVIEALQRRATNHATSVEEEARQILLASVVRERQEFITRFNAVRVALGPQSGPTSLDLLRADRARDDSL
jgi:plasmid stability protein